MEEFNNQPSDVIAQVAEALKAQNTVQESTESSLTDQEATTDTSVKQDETTELNSTEQQKVEDNLQTTDTEAKKIEDTVESISKEDYEKLVAELAEAKKQPKIDFEWVKSEEGQLYLRDLDKIDIADEAVNLAAEKLMKDEGFSRQDALDELEERYPTLFEEDPDTDSKEYKSEERKLRNEAKKQLSALKERKDKIEVPKQEDSETPQIAQEDFTKMYEERLDSEAQRRANIRSQIADKVLEGREKSSVKFGDDIEVEYELSKEVKQKIKNDLTNLESIGSQYINEKGEIDHDGLYMLLAFKNDPSTFFKIYGGVKSAETKEQTINETIKNTNFKAANKGGGDLGVPENHPLYSVAKALQGQGK